MVTITSPRTVTRTIAAEIVRPHRSQFGEIRRVLRRQPIAMAGLTIIVFWLAMAALAPVLPISDPNGQDIPNKLRAPGFDYPLGTDDLGRDMVSRVIWGARISVPAGILVVLATGSIGCLLGAIAGYFGGWLDNGIMRISDAVLSFPSIILAMAITAARGGPGLGNALIAVVLVLWPEYARLMRGQVLSIRTNDFVTAAESLGASRWRILARHILPSTDAPVIVKATAGLSFIGLGAIPPDPEWGAMINQGFRKGLQYWWYSAVPGVAIMSIVMALNFFGDGLRDALDPRRRGQ